MKQPLFIILSALFSAFLFSCGFAPVNNQYERAATLKKGNIELNGSYSGYSLLASGGSGSSNNNFGFRIGYGLSDKVDVKFRYERIMPTENFKLDDENSSDLSGVNYFSIIPKFAFVPEKLSLLVPVSHYSYNEKIYGEESKVNFSSIAPHLIYTFTNKKYTNDLSLGAKADFMFGNDGGALLLGTTVGAGFSSDLRRWAVRPEIGATFLGGSAFLSYGIGFQFLIPNGKVTP